MRPAWAFVLGIALTVAGCIAPPSNDNGGDELEEAQRDWTWHAAAPIGLARGEVGCASDGERHILVAGGLAEVALDAPVLFGVTETTELYDNATGTWTAGPPLPIPLHHLAVAYTQERFWVLGGYPGLSFTPIDMLLSWARGEPNWTIHDAMPVARGAHGVGVIADRIYVVGGVTLDGVTARVDVYNTTTGTWYRAPDAPTVREHLAVDAYGTHVYAAGGRAGAFDSQIRAFDILDTTNDTWTSGPEIPTPRGGSGGAAGAHGFLAAGGEGTGKTFEEVERYDPERGAWDVLPNDPDPRHGLCVATLGKNVHIIAGGHDPGFATSNTHNVFMPAATG